MHPSIELGNQVRAALRTRSRIATKDLYKLIGRPSPVENPRFIVKPAGRDFFHVVNSQTGNVMGFRRNHNEACALARSLEYAQ